MLKIVRSSLNQLHFAQRFAVRKLQTAAPTAPRSAAPLLITDKKSEFDVLRERFDLRKANENSSKWNAFLQTLIAQRRCDLLPTYFQEMHKRGLVNMNTLGIVISQQRDLVQALQSLAMAKQLGTPKRFIYHVVMGLSVQDFKRVEALYQELMAVHSPNAWTFTLVFRSLLQCKQMQFVDKYLAEMKARKVKPDASCCHELLEIFSLLGRTQEMVRCHTELRDMTAMNREAARALHMTMFTGFARANDWQQAMTWLDRAEQVAPRNGQSDPVLCRVLMSSLAKLPKPDPAGVMHIFQQLRAHWRVDVKDFNRVIFAFARTGDVKTATAMLDELRAAGLQPSTDTYTCLLTAYTVAGDLAGVERCADEVHKQKLPLDERFFTALLTAHEKLGSMQSLHKAWQSVVEPSVRHFSIMLRAAAWREPKSIPSLLADMRSRGVRADVQFYGVLAKAYKTARQPLDALACLDHMRADDLQPNSHVLCTVLDALGVGGHAEEAAALYRSMQARGRVRSLVAVNVALKHVRLLAPADPSSEALRLLQTLRNNRVRPDATTLRNLRALRTHIQFSPELQRFLAGCKHYEQLANEERQRQASTSTSADADVTSVARA